MLGPRREETVGRGFCWKKTRGVDIPAPPVEVPTEPPKEPEEPSRDDLDDGMDTGDQSTLSEESGETVSSTEKGGESNLWTGTNHRQPALDEIPDEETAGSPQFKSARLEEPFDDEQEKNWGERNRIDGSPRTYS